MEEHKSINVPYNFDETIKPISKILPISKFCFHIDGNWIIEISKEGIKFNREDFPNIDADGFAKAFCDILEMNYSFSFTKRNE